VTEVETYTLEGAGGQPDPATPWGAAPTGPVPIRKLAPFSSLSDRQERHELIRLLRETPAEMIAASGERDALNAFRRVVRTVPFYRRMIDEQGVDPAGIDSIEAFTTKVPILDKQNTFGSHVISELCVGGNLDGVRSVLTSSGFLSGVFSFGVNTTENLARSAKSIDTGLQYLFGVDEKSTLLINCLPMGVKVHTRAAVLAETSVREDMVFAVVKKFAEHFEQIIIVGEGSFIKKIVEDGAEVHGIDWSRLHVHLITGEEGIAENYRTYLGELVGVDDYESPDGKIIGSSMGVAELDLNIFHETRETIRVRRLAHRYPVVREALFGKDHSYCPMFFVYYPHRCLVEVLDRKGDAGELVISMLSEEMKIPLLRYRSGDLGRTIPYTQLVETMTRLQRPLEPDLKLPFVAVSGRGRALQTPAGNVFPEAVKEALYADRAVARAITGNFRLAPDKDFGRLHVQLRPGFAEPKAAGETLREGLHRYTGVVPAVSFHSFEAFPYNVGVDYERKFAYLGG
jgi:phenylacetate-CoA ligase